MEIRRRTTRSLFFTLLFIFFIADRALAEASFNATLTSDYIARGISQTNNRPAMQGGVEDPQLLENFLAGVWLSNARNVRDETEVDTYVKYSWVVNKDVTVGLYGLFYYYSKDQVYNTQDYQISFENSIATVLLSYRPDFFGTHSADDYLEVGKKFSVDAKKNLSCYVALGYSNFSSQEKAGTTNYLNYRVSLIKAAESFEFAIFLTDTNRENITANGRSKAYDQAIGITISKSF